MFIESCIVYGFCGWELNKVWGWPGLKTTSLKMERNSGGCLTNLCGLLLLCLRVVAWCCINSYCHNMIAVLVGQITNKNYWQRVVLWVVQTSSVDRGEEGFINLIRTWTRKLRSGQNVLTLQKRPQSQGLGFISVLAKIDIQVYKHTWRHTGSSFWSPSRQEDLLLILNKFSVRQYWILCLQINSTTVTYTHALSVLLFCVLGGAGVSMWRGNYLLDQSEPVLSLKDRFACSYSTNQHSDYTTETGKACVCVSLFLM